MSVVVSGPDFRQGVWQYLTDCLVLANTEVLIQSDHRSLQIPCYRVTMDWYTVYKVAGILLVYYRKMYC